MKIMMIRAIVLIAGVFLFVPGHAMRVSGAIQASTAAVTGSVTMSNLVISSLTVTHQLNVTGTTSGITGSVVQMLFASTTSYFRTSSTSFQADPYIAASITLQNAADYVRVSLLGLTDIDNPISGQVSYVTIMRSSNSYTVDLGDPTPNKTGLAALSYSSSAAFAEPVGIVLADLPLQATTYTYQVYIRAANSTGFVGLATTSLVYLTLEEIHP